MSKDKMSKNSKNQNTQNGQDRQEQYRGEEQNNNQCNIDKYSSGSCAPCGDWLGKWCKNNKTVRACVERKWIRNTMFVTAGIFFVTLYWLLKPVSWYVFNEDSEYVNLQRRDNTALVIAGSWKNAQAAVTAIYSAAGITEQMKTINGKVIWLIPADDESSLSTAQLVKLRYKMDITINLAPPALWKTIFKDENETTEPVAILFDHGKEVKRIEGIQRWLSIEGLDMLNAAFNTQMRLV